MSERASLNAAVREDEAAQIVTPSARFIFATADSDLFEARYHIPRSQVYEGSRGGQRGNVHLHVRGDFAWKRILRRRGMALCGRRAWMDRPLDELEVAVACPRCADIERRRRRDSGPVVDVDGRSVHADRSKIGNGEGGFYG